MIHVKVLGSGCANCKRLEAEARAALDEAGIPYELTKVTEMDDIMAYSILSTPGLVINEKLVCSGRIPSQAEVTTWLVNAEMGAESSS